VVLDKDVLCENVNLYTPDGEKKKLLKKKFKKKFKKKALFSFLNR